MGPLQLAIDGHLQRYLEFREVIGLSDLDLCDEQVDQRLQLPSYRFSLRSCATPPHQDEARNDQYLCRVRS